MHPAEGATISNSSSNPGGITYTSSYENNFIHIYNTGGIRNMTSKNLVLLVAMHISYINSSSAGDYSIGTWIKRHTASESTYQNYKYLGFTSSNTGVYCIVADTVYVSIPPGGYIAILVYNQTSGKTIKTASSGWVDFIPVSMYNE